MSGRGSAGTGSPEGRPAGTGSPEGRPAEGLATGDCIEHLGEAWTVTDVTVRPSGLAVVIGLRSSLGVLDEIVRSPGARTALAQGA